MYLKPKPIFSSTGMYSTQSFTNTYSKNLFGVLSIIAHILSMGCCGWICCKKEEMNTRSFLYKNSMKLIITILFLSGLTGFIYFISCDCGDLKGCSKYEGELTCPSQVECQWDGYNCSSDTCYCCCIDITKYWISKWFTFCR